MAWPKNREKKKSLKKWKYFFCLYFSLGSFYWPSSSLIPALFWVKWWVHWRHYLCPLQWFWFPAFLNDSLYIFCYITHLFLLVVYSFHEHAYPTSYCYILNTLSGRSFCITFESGSDAAFVSSDRFSCFLTWLVLFKLKIGYVVLSNSIEVERSLVWGFKLIWIEAGFCFLFAMALGARSFKIPLVSLLLSSLLTLDFPKSQRRYISALAVSIYYIIPQLCWYDDKVWRQWSIFIIF